MTIRPQDEYSPSWAERKQGAHGGSSLSLSQSRALLFEQSAATARGCLRRRSLPSAGLSPIKRSSLAYRCAVACRSASACARRRRGNVGVDQHDPAIFDEAIDEVGSTCAEEFRLGTLGAMLALSAS